MTFLQKISRQIIKKSFHLSVSMIEKFCDMSDSDKKLVELRKLPEGTLGKSISQCLDNHNLRLVPNFESHDMKHVLLGFKMTPVDEIRMQAFMLGNGNYTFPCFAIFGFGAILLPDMWKIFYSDFQLGWRTKPISTWTIDQYAEFHTESLRKVVFDSTYERPIVLSTEKVVRIGAFSAIIAGVFGMIFCLPFLFSANMQDLVGAGFPFVGGSVLAVGGLITLSNLARTEVQAKLS
jgi:hypothetical protein